MTGREPDRIMTAREPDHTEPDYTIGEMVI